MSLFNYMDRTLITVVSVRSDKSKSSGEFVSVCMYCVVQWSSPFCYKVRVRISK